MSWYAVEAPDRAVDATRRFLFPFEAVRWAKLAVLAFAMAGGSVGVSYAGPSPIGVSAAGVGAWTEVAASGSVLPDSERVLGLDGALLAAAAVGAAFVALGLVACSFAFRLALYDAFATAEVALWRPFRERFRQALGMLAFSASLAVAAAIPAVALVVAVDPAALRAIEIPFGGLAGSSTIATAVIGGLALFAAVSALFAAVGSRLTFEFVAPTMAARDVGVLAGWRAVWRSLRGAWDQVVLYLAVHAVVAASAGIVRAVAVASVGGVVAAVGLVVLVLAAVPLGGVEALVGTTPGTIVLATTLLCAIAAVVVLSLPILIVARTYLTAYEVSTLAGIGPELAPLAPTLVARGDSKSIGD
ncbi:hypothetical protein [Halorubrum sp. SD612]|uniref:DUF7544 domain-containing protein n=1 Tax=Halorubrum sp. SD612 TaxID=1855863 RepID=UPI000A2D7C36|nr:hypothetical protein [Halorubrum sp. SD612]OTF10391.1 hypothetical protein B9G38_06475 [Halorubrum sp. SD612]